MSEPARGVSTRARERLVFFLVLAVVVVTAALAGYTLGQYAFSRWIGPPQAPGRPRVAEVGLPPSLPLVPDSQAQPPLAPPVASGSGAAPSSGKPSASVSRPTGSGEAASPRRAAPAGVPPGPVPVMSEGRARADGYFVQVAAFSQEGLARRAAERLAQQGLPVRLVTTGQGSGSVPYFKVWVGPYRERSEAVEAREQLREDWPGAWLP